MEFGDLRIKKIEYHNGKCEYIVEEYRESFFGIFQPTIKASWQFVAKEDTLDKARRALNFYKGRTVKSETIIE